MYAIVRTSGRQFRVSKDDTITVDRLRGEVGDKVELAEVLLIGTGKGHKVGTPFVAGAKVQSEIVRHTLAPKIRGFTFKPKKRVRRRWGHRQQLTELKITNISAGKSSDGT
ncbi:MAG: 50S ribosomal protein L21 [Armatimonadetes bacterium]|nr:50S ribosomal protein L21 [Armatimonadota bacterium]